MLGSTPVAIDELFKAFPTDESTAWTSVEQLGCLHLVAIAGTFLFRQSVSVLLFKTVQTHPALCTRRCLDKALCTRLAVLVAPGF